MDRMRVRLGLLMVLVLLAGPGLAHARPSLDQGPAVTPTHEARFLDRAWGWLVSAFEKAGSFIDPAGEGGQSIGAPPASPNGPGTILPDAGSFIDPAGNGGS